jgi:hypothetical protein
LKDVKMSNLSGRAWWNANQARWPDSEDLDDLDSDWGDDVKKFINILREADARVTIISTRRPRNRAYLMHYSWMIANGRIEPADVPLRARVDIQWDHGDDRISRNAAQEMVDCFGLAHYAAGRRSNHVRGMAIDMYITWRGDLFLGPLPNGGFRGIIGGPRNGVQNRELHEIGALFGVRKKLNDRPHWSHNGR